MKTKISYAIFFFLLLGGIFCSTNIYSQNTPSRLGEPLTVQEKQTRLFALELCHDYYVQKLGSDVSKVDAYIAALKEELANEEMYVHGQVEEFVMTNPTHQNSVGYIRNQAIVAFPEAFNYSAEGLIAIDAELLQLFNQIANQ